MNYYKRLLSNCSAQKTEGSVRQVYRFNGNADDESGLRHGVV